MKLQSFKYRDFIQDIYKLLERYSSNGRALEIGEKEDIQKRIASCTNRAMRKLCAEFGVYRKKVHLYFELPEIICDYGNFEISGDEIFSKTLSGESLLYRLVAGGNGELAFIDCKDSASVSIRNSIGGISEYKGRITPDGENSHFILAGTPKLKVYSFEIYKDDGINNEDLALLGGNDVCTVRLPEDFLKLCEAYDKNGNKISTEIFCVSDNDGTVSVNKNAVGVYTFEYIASHVPFGETYSDRDEIKLPPMLYDALSYMCAAELCPSYDGEMYSKLTYKYREVLGNCYERERKLGNGRNTFYGIISNRNRRNNRKVGS